MELNPFLSVWTQPKETVRQFIKNDKLGYTMILVSIAGIGNILTVLQDSGWFEGFSPASWILGILLGGIIIGFLNLGVNAFLYTFIGKLYGGQGRIRQMAVAVGPTIIPQILLVPVMVFYAVFYGELFFSAPTGFNLTSIPLSAYLILFLLTIIASIWSIVITSKAIGVVHGFSSLRGFGVFMTIVGIFVIITLIAVIVTLMIIL